MILDGASAAITKADCLVSAAARRPGLPDKDEYRPSVRWPLIYSRVDTSAGRLSPRLGTDVLPARTVA
jgi:hypothetical protein